MCSAEPRNLPIPQSPHNNNNSFSSRLHFTPQQKLNKTGGEYRHSNKVSKENIKFHYLPVSTENNSQRTSEAENNTNVKPSPVHTKIKTRDKKTNYLKDDRDRKYNKS